MLHVYLLALGALALALGITSNALRHLPLTEPLAALLLGVVLGPEVLDVVAFDTADAVLAPVAEVSLALSVMAVALRHPWSSIREHARPLALLLVCVLPLMGVVAGGLGALILGLSIPAAALLGASLAPTDPVLAASVVAGAPAERDLPERLRLVVSVESGANDGLAFAFVAVAVAAVSGSSLAMETGRAALGAVVALAVGAAAGWVAGRLVVWADRNREIEHSAFLMLTVVLALFALGAAELAGGSGVLAALIAGLFYDGQVSASERREEWEVQEAINEYLILPVFALLGVALPWSTWASLGWGVVAFAVAVLALRRLPLLVGLRRGLRLDWGEAVFAGWFGPIGVAALYYLADAREVHAADAQVWAAGTLVIALSTLAHGVTAAPGRVWYARTRG